MLKVEILEGDLVRTSSDSGYKILGQDGVLYDEAIDPDWTHRTYTETEILIEPDAEATAEDLEEALKEAGVI